MFLGGNEILVVLLIVLLLFGGSKLPELARSLGKAKNEFKKGTQEEPKGPEELEEQKGPGSESESETKKPLKKD